HSLATLGSGRHPPGTTNRTAQHGIRIPAPHVAAPANHPAPSGARRRCCDVFHRRPYHAAGRERDHGRRRTLVERGGPTTATDPGRPTRQPYHPLAVVQGGD